MNLNMLKNDFKKNKEGNVAIFLFMTLAVMIGSILVLVIGQLFGSINSLYEVAKPPHFLQMHKGELDKAQVEAFSDKYDGLVECQIVEMLDIYGDEISIIKGNNETFSLKECRLDIGFVTQNPTYDLLVDKYREKVELDKGQIGIPVIVHEQFNIEIGDKLVINNGRFEKEFEVCELIYDSQMNSTMCSSTRFLINSEDFAEMHGKIGEVEYIIESYFEDTNMATDYQALYEEESANMPKNGQAVTYTMILLLSGITDMLMTMLYLVIGILLIAIVFFCIKNTLITAMYEELVEIGTMKAIGVSHKSIRNLYLSRMRILLIAGTITGIIGAFILSNSVTKHIVDTFGECKLSIAVIIGSIVAGIVVYLFSILYCKAILGRIKKVNVVDALVTQTGLSKPGKRLISVIICLVVMMITIPVNMVNTMKNEEFITYMGSSIHDGQINIDPGENLEERKEKMLQLIEKEQVQYQVFEVKRFETRDVDGKKKSIHIDTGEDVGKGLQYLEGVEPVNNDEIALSKAEADLLGVGINDYIELMKDQTTLKMRVCGIYQDITSGGMTAKAANTFTDVEPEEYYMFVDFDNKEQGEECIAKWQNEMTLGYSIEFMEDFGEQTIGGVVKQIESVVNIAFIVSGIIVLVIVLLYLKLKYASEMSQIAIKKVIGLTNKRIRVIELMEIIRKSLIGIVSGLLISKLFGEKIISLMLSLTGLGIEKIDFVTNIGMCFIIVPIFVLLLVGITSWIYSKKIEHIEIQSHLRE